MQLRLLILCSLVLLGQDPAIEVVPADSQVTPAQVAAVARELRAAVREIAPRLDLVSTKPFRCEVHQSRTSLPTRVRDALHPGTAGVAFLADQEVHLLLHEMAPRPPKDLSTVARHEVVHILLHQAVGPAGPNVPRWFHEGLAQVLSGGTYLDASEEDIVLQVQAGHYRSFSRLAKSFPESETGLRHAYAQSFSFVSFLQREIGLRDLLEVARACHADADFAAAFFAVRRESMASYEQRWVEYMRSGSGAALRVLLQSCFWLILVAFLPVLVLAGMRRWNRDLEAREALERMERDEESSGGEEDRR